MRDYKLLLMGLILLLLIILLAVWSWMWFNNRKNVNPLPIMVIEAGSVQSQTAGAQSAEIQDSSATNVLYVQAEDKLQLPLDKMIVRFESRYPNIQVLANYVPSHSLLTLADSRTTTEQLPTFMANIDVIIADGKLTQQRLAPLQAQLDYAQTQLNQSKVNTNGMAQDNAAASAAGAAQTDTSEAHRLVSFSYALKGTQAVDGIILTDNPVAINFRNYLLSSAGQDILKQYDYDTIDGYKNSIDDLFNSSSATKSVLGESSEKVADAFSNGN